MAVPIGTKITCEEEAIAAIVSLLRIGPKVGRNHPPPFSYLITVCVCRLCGIIFLLVLLLPLFNGLLGGHTDCGVNLG